MKTYKIMGWVRDCKGVVIKRPLNDICNTITQFVGGGYGNTTPYVVEFYEEDRL